MKTNKREFKGKGSNKNFNKNKRSSDSYKKSTSKEVECKGDVAEYTNDVAWYSKNSQLLFDAANLPYNNPTGAPIKFRYANSAAQDNHKYYLPGIVTLWWRPTPGLSDNNNSPINMAARNIYSFIRQANSGAKNYDSPDLMMYFIAMDSLYAFHAWMMRVYGTLSFTMPTNRYFPKQLVEAQGADYSDLICNMADFRYYINSFAVRLGALAVPNDMYYFTRHRWMSSNVYMDEPSVKPQLYMYNPEGFYKYTLNTDSSGMLEFKPLGDGVGLPHLNLAGIKAYGEMLLDAVLGDEDINVMSGDILKAYGNNLVVIPTVAEDYMVTPVYSAEVLSQIHNATAIPADLKGGIWNIVQDPTVPSIVFNPSVAVAIRTKDKESVTYYPEYALLDMATDMPTASDTMVATRCTSLIKVEQVTPAKQTKEPVDDTPVYKLSLSAVGSEVITGIFTAQMVSDKFTGEPEFALTTMPWYSFNFYDLTADKDTLNIPCMIVDDTRHYNLMRSLDFGACNGMPLSINLIKVETARNSVKKVVYETFITGQKNNLTTVDNAVLSRMHECALLSEFNVPALGLRK